jgi:hypothetical protein
VDQGGSVNKAEKKDVKEKKWKLLKKWEMKLLTKCIS